MADTYTSALKARKIEQGGYSNSYADRFNEDMVDVFDAAIAGSLEIDIGSSTTHALEALQNGTLSDSHYFHLRFVGTPASAVTVTVPASVTPSKEYLVENQTGQALTFKYAATSGVTVQDGDSVAVRCDGTNVTEAVFGPRHKITPAEIAAGVTPVDYSYQPGDVRRYGAVGDGTTDNTAAIQDAIDAAGVAGEVIFPAIGTFLCTGSLTGMNFQTWRGASYELGAGGSQASIKCTLTTGRFITTGSNQVFENLRFLGVMTYTDATGATAASTAICLTLTDSVTFRDCVFQNQFFCFETSSSFYIRMYGGEVNRCAVLMNMVDADVFNLQIDATVFRFCNNVTSSDDGRFVHNLKVMGGSFEQWAGGLFNYIRTASFFGTYWENDIVGSYGFNSNSGFSADTSITLIGCLIFINNLNTFVNYGGMSKATFVSLGNTIAGSVNSGQNQFYFVPPDSGSRVIMLGDYLDDRGTGTFQGTYVSDTSKVRNQLIVWPRGTTADHANAGQTWLDGGVIFKPVALANSATPSVKGGTNFLTGGTTTITDFTNGVEGQEIRILAEHAITITDGTNIFLAGSTNFAMNATDTLSLLCKADGNWYEIGRSDNT
jgi:hypothetical protein